MKYFKFNFISFSLLILTACVPSPEVIKSTVDFDKEAASIINKKGKATVSGQAFLKQGGGGVVTCAGADALLFPATEYAKERITGIFGNEDGGYRTLNVYRGGLFEASTNSDYLAYTRRVVCDAEGDFNFDSVANGEYYVNSTVSWYVGNDSQGGALSKKISVKNGKDVRILLTY